VQSRGQSRNDRGRDRWRYGTGRPRRGRKDFDDGAACVEGRRMIGPTGADLSPNVHPAMGRILWLFEVLPKTRPACAGIFRGFEVLPKTRPACAGIFRGYEVLPKTRPACAGIFRGYQTDQAPTEARRLPIGCRPAGVSQGHLFGWEVTMPILSTLGN
jgi:hypothetical protein